MSTGAGPVTRTRGMPSPVFRPRTSRSVSSKVVHSHSHARASPSPSHVLMEREGRNARAGVLTVAAASEGDQRGGSRSAGPVSRGAKRGARSRPVGARSVRWTGDRPVLGRVPAGLVLGRVLAGLVPAGHVPAGCVLGCVPAGRVPAGRFPIGPVLGHAPAACAP
eukprot:scaffold8853_cov103-Isochrysis_galbana.AAC.3